MLKHLLSTTALVLALSTPAWAQTGTSDDAAGQGQTTEEMNVQGTDQPAAPSTGTAETLEPDASTEGTAEQPGTEAPATGTAETGVETPAADTAATGEAVIPEEQAGQLKAEDLMGMKVVGGQGEDIGEVQDLIFDQDEKITGVVVGVGGFLGIGEKRVALNWDQAQVQPDPDTGNNVVMVNMTKEELEAAPEFKTMEEQESEDAGGQPDTAEPATPMPGTGGATQ